MSPLSRRAALVAAGQRIDRLDARLLLQRVAGCSHRDLIADPDLLLSEAQQATLAALVHRRASGEPLAYLVGEAGFYGRAFQVSPAVLIPRPETEELVTLALTKVAGLSSPRILDLGTGSGCLAITLALECPGARVTAVDISTDALAVAAENARCLGAAVDFRPGSWLAPVAGEHFDLIVSNPPYIREGDPHLVANGLPFEPPGALTDGVAGGDGLACIRAIMAAAPAHLLPGGWLLFEHGYDQGQASRNLLQAAGFQEAQTLTDLSGNDRISGGHL